MLPFAKSDAIIVNVSSSVGSLSRIKSHELRRKLTDSEMTIDDLSRLMNNFIDSVADGSHEEKGWPKQSTSVCAACH